MNVQQIRFGTFNIGTDSEDFLDRVIENQLSKFKIAQCKKEMQSRYPEKIQALMKQQVWTPKEQQEVTQAIAMATAEQMTTVEKSTATRLANSLDVICLQEVNLNRPFIKALQNRGFILYHIDNKSFSTAIAVKNDLFSDIQNISIQTSQEDAIYGREVAAIKATLKGSNTTLAISSLHPRDYKLYPRLVGISSVGSEDYKNPSLEDLENSQQETNKYAEQAISIMQNQHATYSIMAGDMSNDPKDHPNHFDQIKKSGYCIQTPAPYTNMTPYKFTHIDGVEHKQYVLRKSDFIFTPSSQQLSLFQRITQIVKSIFFKLTQITASPATVPKDFDFTSDGNCSNHTPVFTTITITHQLSYLSRLWTAVRNCWCC